MYKRQDGTYVKVKRAEDEAIVDSQMEMYNYFANSWAEIYASYAVENEKRHFETKEHKKAEVRRIRRPSLLRRLRDRLSKK